MSLRTSQPFVGPIDGFSNQEIVTSLRGTLLPSEGTSDEQCSIAFVPKGMVTEEPLQIEITEKQSRLLVVIQEGAQAQVHIQLLSDGDDALHTTEIFVEDDAELNLLFFQASDAPSLTIRQRSSIGANAKLHLQNVSLGSGELEHNLLSDVNGAKSESSVDWLFYSKDQEKQIINARNAFHAREGEGEIVMKGVAEGKAHSVCMGMIDIDLNGGGTDTYLTEDVLMLDKTAKVDAIPGLEIKTNDVKASHSATVSKVTLEDLFYFASRGISEGDAREMYVLGFLGDLTNRIVHKSEREVVMEAIERKYRN